MVNTKQRRNLLRGLFESYYSDLKGKDVILDTNRMWCSKLPALLDLFPDTKVIACVRNVAWVMDSLESKFRENPYENTRLFNDEFERNTVYSRVEVLAQRNRLVGFAWSALKEAYYSEQADSLLLVDYDLLSQAPEKVLPLIYEFIGEDPYEHDFDNVEFNAPDFDAALGVSGLHQVRSKVEFQPRQTILPPDLFEQYSQLTFWNDAKGSSRANVIRVNQTS